MKPERIKAEVQYLQAIDANCIEALVRLGGEWYFAEIQMLQNSPPRGVQDDLELFLERKPRRRYNDPLIFVERPFLRLAS